MKDQKGSRRKQKETAVGTAVEQVAQTAGTGAEQAEAPIQNHKYSFKVSPNSVRFAPDPNNKEIIIIHAYPLVNDFPNGVIPDDVNPRSHEKLPSNISGLIEESLITSPEEFHLRNRGITVLAEKASYDEETQTLTFTCPNPNVFGVVDGATTDRTLARVKLAAQKEMTQAASEKDKEKPKEETPPPMIYNSLVNARVHVEILTGDIGEELVPLASARNTSVQVKEFALENLAGGFDFLKAALGKTEFASRIKYRENDPQPVDIREILGLLTMFHFKWNKEKKEPVEAYSSKGRVLQYYQSEEWRPGYESLVNVAPDILRLYDHIQVTFPAQYEAYKASIGSKARFGMRKEVKVKQKGVFTLPLTQQTTPYLVPDGWIYPTLAAFRMLLNQRDNFKSTWHLDPIKFFDQIGTSLVADVVDESDAMNRSATAVGRARPLWNSLRKSVEMRRLNIEAGVDIEHLVDTRQAEQGEGR